MAQIGVVAIVAIVAMFLFAGVMVRPISQERHNAGFDSPPPAPEVILKIEWLIPLPDRNPHR